MTARLQTPNTCYPPLLLIHWCV